MKSWSELWPKLVEPFSDDEIKSRVQRTSKPKDKETRTYPDGTRGLMVDYIDARAVMDRLDETAGPACWSDSYNVVDFDAKVVECSLSVSAVDEDGMVTTVKHADVGYPNGKSDDEEHWKSSYSDALKRAAVKFGMGRHLYDREPRWEDVNKYGQPVKYQAPKQERQRGPEPEAAATDSAKPASSAQIACIRGQSKKLGWTDEQLHDYAQVESLKNLTGGPEGTASALITELDAKLKEKALAEV